MCTQHMHESPASTMHMLIKVAYMYSCTWRFTLSCVIISRKFVTTLCTCHFSECSCSAVWNTRLSTFFVDAGVWKVTCPWVRVENWNRLAAFSGKYPKHEESAMIGHLAGGAKNQSDFPRGRGQAVILDLCASLSGVFRKQRRSTTRGYTVSDEKG